MAAIIQSIVVDTMRDPPRHDRVMRFMPLPGRQAPAKTASPYATKR
jgi:hypothetical protein